MTGAGPVGGLPWTVQALDALTAAVPAASVDLGVAGYGYTYPAEGAGSLVGDAAARALAGSGATWDDVQGELTATTADGTVLWWSDARSLQVRASLATARGLHGLALWSLTLSDPVD